MLKQEYQELFHSEDAENNAKHMYDSIEYLELLHEEGKLNTNFAPIKEKFIYHASCHLRAQGFGLPSLEVLSLIPGLEIENADAGCCGISGSYGFKKDKRAISVKVGEKLFNRIKQSGAKAGVSECGTCRLQMTSGSNLESLHPLTILSRAYSK